MTPHRSTPAVSVIIPAYKAAVDVPEALDSVFAQTFTHFEIILVNDGSPDTLELEVAIARHRSHIRYIVQPNRGAGAARNAGIRAASGRYLAFLDADDLWAPDFLSRQTSYLEMHEQCALVYADAVISGESPLAGRRFTQNAPSEGPVDLRSVIEQRCNVLMSTVVARRQAVVAAGLFDEALRRGQDFDLWLRLALDGHEMAYQRDVLAFRRVRFSGLSGDTLSQLERAIDVLERFGERHPLPYDARTALRCRLVRLLSERELERAKLRLLEGNFAAARYHIEASQPKALRTRLALLGLRVTPQLVRRVYVALRHPMPPRPATVA
ncbi:MAG TPA: glycosyltransferase family A protein [Vicinamibacterales bacterium]|jgi:glycosyltransferase involved in cell wall biosynthesis|nr:glycosyltransferase family A protein [Vicinamibacterales bacterium]